MFTPSPQTRCASARSLFIYSCFRALASAMALLLHLRPRKPISRALRMEKPTSSWVRYSGFLRDLVAASVWPSFKVSPKNQSRPLRKSDGSDFFIARLRQIYRTALILEKLWQRFLAEYVWVTVGMPHVPRDCIEYYILKLNNYILLKII